MKKALRYAASGLRSTLFLTVLGCLLVAGMAGGIWQPAAAAHSGAAPLHPAPTSPAVGPTPPAPAVQAVGPTPPVIRTQDQIRDTPLEGGSVLEFRDGKLSCRAATEEEAQTMRRDPNQPLRALSDEAFAPNPTEQPHKGLKIILRGTPQLEQFPEAKAAFLRAAHTWESLIQNPITVVIDVDFGPTDFGKPFGENQYGLTQFQRTFDASVYSKIRSALIRSAGSPQEAALYNSLPAAQLPTDLGATTGLIYHIAPMRALGQLAAVADPDAEQATLGSPPSIAFNSAISFDFDPSDGIRPKRIDFNAAAMHEIGHALGFFSGVGLQELYPNAPPQTPDVLDIFRFRPGVTSETFATTPRILSSGGDHIFFGGGPELPFSTGRPDESGGDGRQAGHWKDDSVTGRYIGIMDPVFDFAVHYEITANDLQAMELIGYRTNPLPSPQEAELKLDDGAIDTGALSDGLIVINRLTPPSYPATLRKLRILIPAFNNQPDPAGKPITLVYASGTSNGQPPPAAQFTRVETTVPSASIDLFLEFPIPNGPTINSGDFYVGYQVSSPHQGVGFGVDTSGTAENRSFGSINNGASFFPLPDGFQGKPVNAMIRALVSVGVPAPPPTPTPTPTPLPPFTAVALTSGMPKDGYMPRSSPTGAALEETQYTIQIPSGATQLKIELSANADLDLFARFGKPVATQNGLAISDFQSVSDAYQESIIITPASSPALRPGVYYLMVVNYGPGPSPFKITATVNGADPAPGKVVSVSAANYDGAALASEAIVAAFGTNLATTIQEAPDGQPPPTLLAGTRVLVKDSGGTERAAQLFFVSPNQINYLIPPGTAVGPATVTVTNNDKVVSVGTAQIATVAPGLFTANADGQGAPNAVIVRVKADGSQSFESVFQYDSAQRKYVTRPLDFGEASDQLILVLFGTGLRHHQGLSAVSVKIGGVESQTLFAGPAPNFVGLDQINARLPRSLAGRGEVDVALTADGKPANVVRINIR